MADTLCALTELPTTMCAHCLGKVGPDEGMARYRRRLLATGRWFAAQYPGRCEKCGELFEVGTAIQMDMSVPQGWRAECCAEVGRG